MTGLYQYVTMTLDSPSSSTAGDTAENQPQLKSRAKDYPRPTVNNTSFTVPIHPDVIDRLSQPAETDASTLFHTALITGDPDAVAEELATTDTGGDLPPRPLLVAALASLHQYLDGRCARFLVDNHLEGAAGLLVQKNHLVYSQLGADAWGRLLDSWAGTTPFQVSGRLRDAIVDAHDSELETATNMEGVSLSEDGTWAVSCGQQVEAVHGFVVTPSFPVASINDHPVYRERGISLAAGAEQLADDVSGLGLFESSIYVATTALNVATTGDDLRSTVRAVAQLFTAHEDVLVDTYNEAAREIGGASLPVSTGSEASYRYYMSEDAADELFTVQTPIEESDDRGYDLF